MDPHKSSLRRRYHKLAHLKFRDQRDRRRDTPITGSPPLQISIPNFGEPIQTSFADIPSYEDSVSKTPPVALAREIASLSVSDDSGESSEHLRRCDSLPAMPVRASATSSDNAMRGGGELETDHPGLSFDLSPLDDRPGTGGLDMQHTARLSPVSMPSRTQTPNLEEHSDHSRIDTPPLPPQFQVRRRRRSLERLHVRRNSPSVTRGRYSDPYQVLLPLQSLVPDNSDAHEAELTSTDDPGSWNVINPAQADLGSGMYSLEQRAELLFSADHLRVILEEPKLLFSLSEFLKVHRPWRLTLLQYYWDAVKALRAMNFARAISDTLSERPLPCIGSAATLPSVTIDARLAEAANEAFDDLVREDLAAYIAHVYTRIVSNSVHRRITGSLATHLREASHGLAEVFVLTDPTRHDQPIILASEEFALTTQYGLRHVIGRNCRFLQGPKTNPHSVRRLAIACAEGKDHMELLVNYRRDGTPFLNLLMIAPLRDSKGIVRYFLGAQVDVSGLLKDVSSLESLRRLVANHTKPEDSCKPAKVNRLQAMKDLSLMLGGDELDVVRQYGGYLNQGYSHLHDTAPPPVMRKERSRILLQGDDEDPTEDDKASSGREDHQEPDITQDMLYKRLESVYKNYLVVRPAPSLRILFASPSLRVPGMLQTHLLHRIGGNSKIRVDFEKSLRTGNAVTARVHWLSVPNRYGDGIGRMRWLHCTPLLHHSGAVGVWVVIVVDEDDESTSSSSRSNSRLAAPPIRSNGVMSPDPHNSERLAKLEKDFNIRPRAETPFL